MRGISCGVLFLLVSVAASQDRPKEDEPKPGGAQEVIISLADTPKAMADQIKAGSVVDIVVEESSSLPSRTVFYARRVTVVVDDTQKKDGHTITVNLTRAQAQAFDALKVVSKVTVEVRRDKDSAKPDSTKSKRPQAIEDTKLEPEKLQAAKDHCEKGLGFYRSKTYAKAITELTEAIRIDPDNSYYIKTRGIVYRASGELDRAIADFSEAIRIRPDYAAALLDRGIAYAAKKDVDRAIADYTKAIEVHPKYSLAYEKRSEAYSSKGEKALAQADLQEAHRLEAEKATINNTEPPKPSVKITKPSAEVQKDNLNGIDKERLVRVRSILQQAREAANNISDEGGKVSTMEKLAGLHVKVSDVETALRIAEGFKNTNEKDEILAKIALAYAEMADSEAANRTVSRITDQSIRLKAETLAQIVVVLIEAERPNSVQPILQQAVELSKKVPRNSPFETIVWAQAISGDIKSARQTVEMFKRFSTDSADSKAYLIRAALYRIAEAQARTGDLVGAEKTAESLDPTGLSICYSFAYIKMASAAAAKGDINAALKYVGKIEFPEHKVKALAEIVKRQIAAGKYKDTKDMCSLALELAGTITHPNLKVQVLGEVATMQANAGDIEAALRTANSIQEVRNLDAHFGDFGTKAVALADIAVAQVKAKELQAARTTLDQALRGTNKMSLLSKY